MLRVLKCRAPTVLFVDDDSSLRATMAAVLENAGYTVRTAENVSDGLKEIGQHRFDALISDLNIGEPGDGFTLVSAMRRTQPHCVTVILTGYPAFESALEAIRKQVDDYLVKPADPQKLLRSIAHRLAEPTEKRHARKLQSVAAMLRAKADEIVSRTLALMLKSDLLACASLSDEERIDHLPEVVADLITQLESSTPDESTFAALTAAAIHGRARRNQCYTLDMLAEDTRTLDHAIHEVIEANLLDLKLSNLISDLNRINDTLSRQLEASIRAYLQFRPVSATDADGDSGIRIA